MDIQLKKLFFLVALLSIAQVAHGEVARTMRVYASSKNNEIVAKIEDVSNWCKRDMVFEVHGVNEVNFTDGEVDSRGRHGRFLLSKLLGVIRVGLQKECPQVESITLNGFVKNEFIFRGIARKEGGDNWVLVPVPIALVSESELSKIDENISTQTSQQDGDLDNEISTNALNAIEECDSLAAHPQDPLKPLNTKGVEDDDIKAGEAAEKCEIALEEDDESPRLMYQLARAYLAYGKTAEGVELMVNAAEYGHAVAIATLGDIVLYGVLNDEPNPERAKALYLKAAAAGFLPARALADSILENPEIDISQSVPAEPNFIRPKSAAMAIAGSELPGHDKVFVENLIYTISFMVGIKHHCKSAGLETINVASMIRSVGGKIGLLGFAALDAYGNGGYGPLEQVGMDDGYALAVTKGCQSKEVAGVHLTIKRSIN